MTADANRRSSNRVDARVKVQFKNGREFVACYSENISKGGIFLQSEVPPDPNATLEIVLDFPEGVASSQSKAIVLKGKVVRLMSVVDSGKAIHKVAVQFIELTPQIQMQLDLLYESLLKKAG